MAPPGAPVGNDRSQRGGEAQGDIGVGQPGQTTVRGQATANGRGPTAGNTMEPVADWGMRGTSGREWVSTSLLPDWCPIVTHE
jgi:hypothetical protein